MVSSKAKMVSIVFRAELIARSAKTRPRPSGPEAQRAGSREPLRRAPSKFYEGLHWENSRRGPGVPHGTPALSSTTSAASASAACARPARGRGMGDQRPPGNQAERPLRRAAGLLRFRSSTDRIFSCTLMRIKFASIPLIKVCI
jgi:hypothetical protein